MKRLVEFLKTTLVGGVFVVLPLVLLVLAVDLAIEVLLEGLPEISDDVAASLGIPPKLYGAFLVLLACFLVGVSVQTRVGGRIFDGVDSALARRVPGYNAARRFTHQLRDNRDESLFPVVNVAVNVPEVERIGFITSAHEDGKVTVFVPGAPNPTSGMVCRVPVEHVSDNGMTMSEALEHLLNCGADAKNILSVRPKE